MDNIAIREAEKIIISAILQNKLTAFESGLDGLEFGNSDFSNIFLAVKSLTQDGSSADLISVSNYLASNVSPGEVPINPQMLANVIRSVELPANLRPALNILTANKARKRLKDLSESLTSWSEDYADSPLSIVERAESQLERIRQSLGLRATNRRHISEIMAEMEGIYENLRDGISYNIPTGIEAIDKVTGGGGAPGDVWVIGAFTGQGKSALALQMAINQSSSGIPAMIISREMRDEENAKRAHANISETPLWLVKPGMNTDTYTRLVETVEAVARHDLYIDSESSDIHTVCRELEDFAKNGGKVAYVDYLQLLEGIAGKMMSRTEEIAYCSKMLKKTAIKTGLWIIELAQYNRLANYAGSAENHSFDGSSQIEKDASAVLHLELEKPKDGELPPRWRRATLRMSKARNSAHTSADIWFRGEMFRFQSDDPFSLENRYKHEQDIEI